MVQILFKLEGGSYAAQMLLVVFDKFMKKWIETYEKLMARVCNSVAAKIPALQDIWPFMSCFILGYFEAI